MTTAKAIEALTNQELNDQFIRMKFRAEAAEQRIATLEAGNARLREAAWQPDGHFQLLEQLRQALKEPAK